MDHEFTAGPGGKYIQLIVTLSDFHHTHTHADTIL